MSLFCENMFMTNGLHGPSKSPHGRDACWRPSLRTTIKLFGAPGASTLFECTEARGRTIGPIAAMRIQLDETEGPTDIACRPPYSAKRSAVCLVCKRRPAILRRAHDLPPGGARERGREGFVNEVGGSVGRPGRVILWLAGVL